MSDKDKAAEKVKEAQERFKLQQVNEGLRLLYEAGKLDPENVEIFNMIGRGEQAMMNNLGAIAAYEQVVKLNPEDHEAFARLAASYLELSQLEEGNQAIQKAFAIFQAKNQPVPKPYQDVAKCLVLFKARNAAEAEFKQNPMTGVRLEDQPEAYAKVEALQKGTRLDMADVDALLKEYPQISDLFFWRASLYAQIGAVEIMMHDFTRATFLAPSIKAPYIERARLWLSVNRFAEALAETEKVFELEPDNVDAIGLRGAIFEMKGDKLAANRENEKLLNMDLSQHPNPRILLQQGNLFVQHKRWDEAIHAFEQILARPNMPKDIMANAYYFKGKLFMNIQRQSEAVDCASKAVELMPNMPDFCHLLGESGKQSRRVQDEIRGWEAYIAALKAGARGFLPLYVAENFLKEAEAKL